MLDVETLLDEARQRLIAGDADGAGQLFARRVYLLAYHVFVGRETSEATRDLLRKLYEAPLIVTALTETERTLLQRSLNRALHLGAPTGDLVDFAELPKPPTWP